MIFPLAMLALTLGTFLLGVEVQKRTGWAAANPTLIAIVLVGATLRVAHIDYTRYFAGAQFIHFLLGPATVALAIPLVRSIEHMRRGFAALTAALAAGSLVGMLSGYGLVRLCGGPQDVALSMMAKCLTTPIAMGVAEVIGGVPSLTAVLAIAGGILVAVSVDTVLRWMRVDAESAKGLAAGTAGSGIGASRVIPQGTVTAAFAGVGIGLNGVVTSVLAPWVSLLLKHWRS